MSSSGTTDTSETWTSCPKCGCVHAADDCPVEPKMTSVSAFDPMDHMRKAERQMDLRDCLNALELAIRTAQQQHQRLSKLLKNA